MEVASGEYGNAVPTLVMAVKTYKTTNTVLLTENDIGIQLQGISSVSKNIANDISKINVEKTTTKLCPVAASTVALANDTYKKSNNADHTLINLSTNDDFATQNKGASEVCTTSLLDSNDSVVTLPNKNSFPTSGWSQFWILLKRAFKTILRDKQLMHLRLLAHVIVGTIIGMIYYDIGNEGSKVLDNLGCTFFTMLFTMFTGMMPTILTCKCGFFANSESHTHILSLFELGKLHVYCLCRDFNVFFIPFFSMFPSQFLKRLDTFS